MKITEDPSQTAPAGDAAIATLAGINGLTSMVIAFETAGLPLAQVAVDVTTQVTI
ncbi:hypothetical protein DSECCO2_433420 [anaerobic digester metagenome]